jgi:hypothetical protein
MGGGAWPFLVGGVICLVRMGLASKRRGPSPERGDLRAPSSHSLPLSIERSHAGERIAPPRGELSGATPPGSGEASHWGVNPDARRIATVRGNVRKGVGASFLKTSLYCLKITYS